MSSDLILGPVIVTKYKGPTDTENASVIAIHKRDNDETWRHSVEWDDSLSAESNHLAAAQNLLNSWPYVNKLQIVGRGHDANAYYFICSTGVV
jgi:hypothetical protein